ncbi:MAG TPA: small ribosomal subunit Rsm22 family protein [Candidatus Angelobacter sp.]|nr:small ribosomal subunit Rsm22 family protein [Candidatus Angelobacter sp.]
MRLIEEFRDAIDFELAGFERGSLVRASAELTRRYKNGQAHAHAPIVRDPALRAAYLAARLPATFAAISRVLQEIRSLAPRADVRSLLDLGAGPGTALWAAATFFPSLEQATLIEGDAAWIEIGRRLAARSRHAPVRQAEWIQHDLWVERDLPQHDLVVLSYSLGELPLTARASLLRQALKMARPFLVVIEPGTMRGFEVIHGVRSASIAAGAGILAPCTHRNACPLAAAGDWCHFSQRVERSSLHRWIKGGDLSYEDEKFSYIVADKESIAPEGEASRIVRHPQKHSGHIQLSLCNARGAERVTVTRSDKDEYKAAKRAAWGDLWKYRA